MRPRGEVRQAVTVALEQLHELQGAASARDVACRAQVAFGHADTTLKNMARAGAVTIVGKGRLPGQRWHHLYQPRAADDPRQAWGGLEALAAAMRCFVPTPAE